MKFENLKKLRLERGLTQKELCKALETVNFFISRTTYSKYESGSRQFSHEVLIKFALFFDTSIDYILGITDETSPHIKNESYYENLHKILSFK